MTELKRHFIRQIIEDDLQETKHESIVTRFPPEPNGYLHIGHAKSICLNFSLAQEYPGVCHLRFDDTNPIKEEQEYVDAIKEDVRWLGFDWADNLFHASDYFDKLYQFAIALIKQGNAYIDGSSPEEMRERRGTLTQAGENGPDRERSIEDNLALFERMKNGEFEDGQYVLRAKIDMASGNLNLRDPVLYRIRHTTHQRTGDAWCIYPMYDYAHSVSDAIEGITHSLCTLEFQDHRPLYDWCVDNVPVTNKPRQYEFARLNLSHTLTSKRKLKQLVDDNTVEGWDDPRMPTIRGLRRRGVPAAAIRHFCEMIGISKSDSVIDASVFEECVRDELNKTAARAMAVLDPIKVTLSNYPEDKEEQLSAAVHPQDDSMGKRTLPFSRELYIERDDFLEDAPSKFFRLAPGKEVRLRNAYVIRCEDVIKDDNGQVQELICTYDADTLGKKPEGRKVKGVIHWLNAKTAQTAELRLYDRLFQTENPAAEDDFMTSLNPNSLTRIEKCFIEPSLVDAKAEDCFQFERVGYFCRDNVEQARVFNRVVGLRDSWAKEK